jgi:hypothetical protein
VDQNNLRVHKYTFDHLPAHTRIQQFNKAFAVKITAAVGSMWCAYVFTLLACVSLPAVLSLAFPHLGHVFPHWLIAAGLIALVSWIAQTFLQLVLLSVIIVGQNVQAEASDARSLKTFEDTEVILDRLDISTTGGLQVIMAKLTEIELKNQMLQFTHGLVLPHMHSRRMYTRRMC